MAKAITLKNETLQEAVLLYQAGYSFVKIGQKLGYSGEFIRNTLNKHGVISRQYHEINRKHLVNENYFDNIDTEEKAYFMGFLYADGNVNSNSNSIVLKLKQTDRAILSLFSYAILNKESLYQSENNYLVKFSSHHVKQQLIALGCVPNKSLILQWPDWLKSDLQCHFIRGYFDGDGSICRHHDDFAFSIVGTNNFCQVLKKIIFDATNINGKIVAQKETLQRGNHITKIFECGGNRKILKLMTWMYHDATIYLERKHDIYLQLANRIQEVDLRHGNRYVNLYNR